MKSKKALILSQISKIFDKIGENIKFARKRRKLTAAQVAERAGIHRATNYLFPTVTLHSIPPYYPHYIVYLGVKNVSKG